MTADGSSTGSDAALGSVPTSFASESDAERIAGLEARLEAQLQEIAKRREEIERATGEQKRLSASLKELMQELTKEKKLREAAEKELKELDTQQPAN